MNHITLVQHLQATGFTEQDAKLISAHVPKGMFTTDKEIIQAIGKCLVAQLKTKRFTSKQFAKYLESQASITNARRFLSDDYVEEANKTPKVLVNDLPPLTTDRYERIK